MSSSQVETWKRVTSIASKKACVANSPCSSITILSTSSSHICGSLIKSSRSAPSISTFSKETRLYGLRAMRPGMSIVSMLSLASPFAGSTVRAHSCPGPANVLLKRSKSARGQTAALMREYRPS